jgi:hypothetical protein
MGEVALLLWGVHMVHSGVLRAFGGDLRRWLGLALRNRLMPLLAGAGATLAFQSSTATALMVTSFLASGVIGLVPALAVMLGANVSTAVITCALAFDITLVFPVLIFAGLVTFRVGTRTRTRNIGRSAIGLGLILLALHALPMIINGSVAGPERQKRVDTFQAGDNGFDVIILSPRAGGVGLTLTAANHVIHLSRWWNPAVEDQCTDRVYRIGQERDVHVYYLQAIHPEFGEQSFDRRLHNLLERKRALSREMLMPPLDPENDARRLYEETVGAIVA